MNVQLASDLHLETLDRDLAGGRLIEPAPQADVLVLAGDIHSGTRAVEVFRDWPVPVVYVAGNHEFYGLGWEETRAALRQACVGTRISFLDDDVAEIAGVRFLGCTLWTDFTWPGMSHEECVQAVDADLDRHRIHTRAGLLRSRQLLEDHRRSRRWLERELARPYDGCTVVVSHHGPHRDSIHARHAGNLLNAAFVSDLSLLLPGVDLWLHGHVHDSFDYRVGRCRVVANPAGYALKTPHRNAPALAPAFQNVAFDPDLVLEIDAAFDRLELDGMRGLFAVRAP